MADSDQQDVFNRAARDLPEGWEIRISIERGFAGIGLYDEHSSFVEQILADDDTLEQQIDAAVLRAIEISRHKRRRGSE